MNEIGILYSLLKNLNDSELKELCRTFSLNTLNNIPNNYTKNDLIDKIVEDSKRIGIVEQIINWARQKLGLTEKERIDFLILTALKKEFDAIKQKFSNVKLLDDDISHSTTVGKHNVILAYQYLSGQSDAAAMTEKLCESHRPRYVLLVGIAGGNQKQGIELGDILVSSTIEDCSKGKMTGDSEWQPNWQPFTIDSTLIRKTRELSPNNWYKLIEEKQPKTNSFSPLLENPFSKKGQIQPNVKEGIIISGGNVIKEKQGGKWIKTIEKRNPNWLGVEMEGGGVATAIYHYAEEPKPKFLMIRCVSDFADPNKNDLWHPYACDVVAAYTYAFLENLDI